MTQELSKCKDKNEIKRILRKRRNTRDLYLVQVKSVAAYKRLSIKPHK